MMVSTDSVEDSRMWKPGAEGFGAGHVLVIPSEDEHHGRSDGTSVRQPSGPTAMAKIGQERGKIVPCAFRVSANSCGYVRVVGRVRLEGFHEFLDVAWIVKRIHRSIANAPYNHLRDTVRTVDGDVEGDASPHREPDQGCVSDAEVIK